VSASLSPFRPAPRGQRVVRTVAIAVSVGVHVVLALLLARNPTLVKKAATWVEVQVRNTPPPVDAPPPPPEPEKPRPKPRQAPPKSVAFEQTVAPEDAPPPQEALAPPDPKPQMQRVQGLSANSFAPGAGTALSVRAGNSTAVRADGKGLDLDAANGPFLTRPASAVAVQPKVKWEPAALDVPEAAREARVEGTVEIVLDVDAEGKVARVAVVRDLGYGTGEACADAWRRSTWKPGEHQGVPVAVTGIRKLCTIRIQ
jgi:protein TonB